MNDPGLQDPIADVSHDVDDKFDDKFDSDDAHLPNAIADEAEAERQYLDPSSWWFASTACPLIAGTFGPMANAFSICALGTFWRESIPPGGSEVDASPYPDPAWLIAVNAVSLGAALVANVALLFSMANRAPFWLSQSLTILGFFAAAVLLIGLLGAASRQAFLGDPAANALTQAFYYGIWAAGIYTILALLMLATAWGAWAGKYERRFYLTFSQRTLMLQTISFMVYLLLGALVFSHVEGWNYLDAVFWADFTLLTIGLGSPLVPATHAGRSLLIPFALGGIVSVGLIIGSIRSMLLETGKAKMKARTTERMRTRARARWPAHLPEREQRRAEFHAMRAIQARAVSRNKWGALAVSATLALLLWFVGAVVFERAEYIQGWSYFDALYFSYTSLLTIGYGDYQPYSNAGKAFFVLWSLLAVPALTVLISDMGDTVVKLVRDATDAAGALTILPGAHGTRSAWRAGAERARAAVRLESADVSPADDATTPADAGTAFPSDAHFLRARLPHGLAGRARELFSSPRSSDTHSPGDDGTADHAAFHRWLLARELAALHADAASPSPKTYTYDEWSYFLRLLGHDEAAPARHARPDGKRGERAARVRLADGDVDLGRPFDAEGRPRAWSWMGIRSPLMSSREEADWLVGEMAAALARASEERAGESEPPVRLGMLEDKDEGRDEDGGTYGEPRSGREGVGFPLVGAAGGARARLRDRVKGDDRRQ